jgi:hypothetical protein
VRAGYNNCRLMNFSQVGPVDRRRGMEEHVFVFSKHRPKEFYCYTGDDDASIE